MAERIIDGVTVLVDDKDAPVLDMYPWTIKDGYVVHGTVKLHRLITGAPPKMAVDHVNRVRHDNRRENLRVCTPAENNRNRAQPKNPDGTLKNNMLYKGVRRRGNNTWWAYVTVGGKTYKSGPFTDPEIAAVAYDHMAVHYHGQYACTNMDLDHYDDENSKTLLTTFKNSSTEIPSLSMRLRRGEITRAEAIRLLKAGEPV